METKTEIEQNLSDLEMKIRKEAKTYTEIKENLEKSERKLRDNVYTYQALRESAQREIWKKDKLGYCQNCDKFYSHDDIVFIYTEGKEWRGSHGYESHSFYRGISSLCQKHAEYLLSRPRGGEDKFQCYKARKLEEENKFEIFISGSWQPLSDLAKVHLEIEKGYISKEEFVIGKSIIFCGSPLEIKIEEESITRFHI